MNLPKLENWSIVRDESNPFLAPELRNVVLQGEVYGHKNFEDGVNVSTSSLEEINVESRIAQTRNTTYELGEPSIIFLNWLEENGHRLEDYNC